MRFSNSVYCVLLSNTAFESEWKKGVQVSKWLHEIEHELLSFNNFFFVHLDKKFWPTYYLLVLYKKIIICHNFHFDAC